MAASLRVATLWVLSIAVLVWSGRVAAGDTPPSRADPEEVPSNERGLSLDHHEAAGAVPHGAHSGSVTGERSSDAEGHSGERRVALVIGNGAYERGALENPPNDAHLIALTLRSLDFEVYELLNGTQEEMKRAIAEFGSHLKSSGVGVFYYAGHGLQAFGRNYLVPVDARIESHEQVDVDAIDVNRVMAAIEVAKPRVSLVLLDSCRDNPFASRSRDFKLGLAAPRAPKGTVVAYAAAPGMVAEDGTGSNSPFSAAVARGMRQPNQELSQMLKQVGREVDATTEGRQIPWVSTSATGDFYFVPGSEPLGMDPVIPPGEELLAPRDGGKPTLAYVLGGTGIVLVGSGAIFGMLSLKANEELEEVCPEPRACQALDKETKRDNFGLLATAGIGVGAAALATASIIWFGHEEGVEPGWHVGRSSVRLDTEVTVAGGGMTLSGTF